MFKHAIIPLDLGEGMSILDSTCLDTVVYIKYAQTLLQHISRKPKHFVSSKPKHYLAPISVLLTLVSVFLNT